MNKTFGQTLQELINTKSNIIKTHYTELDNCINGLQRGDLITIGGRPSIGKTSLALNISENIAIYEKLPVIIFSLEMNNNKLTTRMLCSRSRVNHHCFVTQDVTCEEMDKIRVGMNELVNAPIHFIESTWFTISDICDNARKMSEQLGELGVIVIDYIQLINSTNKDSYMVRSQEIAQYTRDLKHLAKELNVPIIIVSEVNRDAENRLDKRPKICELRDSGSIEDDSDVILLLYRDDVYDPEYSRQKGVAEINIAKNKSGPTRTCIFAFLSQYMRFENLMYNYEDYDQEK